MLQRFQERAEQTVTGFQSPCDDHLEGRLNIVDRIVIDAPNTFYAAMDSDEMRTFGIRMSDILVIDKSLQPVPGCIVLAFFRGTFYIRELATENSIPILKCDFKTIRPDNADDLIIWGVATALCRNLLPQALRKGRYKMVCAL